MLGSSGYGVEESFSSLLSEILQTNTLQLCYASVTAYLTTCSSSSVATYPLRMRCSRTRMRETCSGLTGTMLAFHSTIDL